MRIYIYMYMHKVCIWTKWKKKGKLKVKRAYVNKWMYIWQLALIESVATFANLFNVFSINVYGKQIGQCKTNQLNEFNLKLKTI